MTPSAPPPPNVAPGQLLGDRYRLGAELGRGGMGVVYRALDSSTGGEVALKVLLGPEGHEANEGRDRRARLMREARVASQIQHPNVVRVLDYTKGSEPVPYLVMELVSGRSLGQLLDGALPEPMACNLCVQVLRALGHLHASGIVHRDIKPENVLVSLAEDGLLLARVTDFGILRRFGAAESDATQVTADGLVVGTPAFMSPEQSMGAALIGPQVDLYAVGVSLYLMLAGQLPFVGTAMQMLAAKMHGELIEPPNRASWSDGLWAIVRRLTAVRPEQRHAFAADVIADLQPYASDEIDDRTREALTSSVIFGSASGKMRAAQLASQPTIAVEPEVSSHGPPREVWGRDEVLAQLTRLAVAAESGAHRCAVLTGFAGSGKTLVANHLARGLAEEGRFQSVYVSLGADVGLAHGLSTAMDRLLGSTGEGPARVRRRLTELLRQLGDADAGEVDALTALARPDDSEHRALSQQIALFVRLLRRLSTRRAVLLVLDDVDRCGAEGSALLEQIACEAQFEPLPLFAIATARREEFVGDARARRSLAACTTHVALGPIAVEALVEGLLGELRVSMETARRVALRSSGNPYFARLLGRAALAGESTDEGARVSGEVPDELRALLSRHVGMLLSALPDAARLESLCANVAVLGPIADVELLARFSGDPEDALDVALDRLIDAGLLVEERNGDAVRFEQDLLRDVILDDLSRRTYRRLHQRAAELRMRVDEGSDEQAAAIGHHLAAAGDEPAAVQWWCRAVAHASRVGDLRQVVTCGYQARRLLARNDPASGPLLLALAQAERHVGNVDVARDLAAEAANDANPERAALAIEMMADCAQELGDRALWRIAVERLETLAAGATPPVQRARDRALLFWLNNLGRGREALVLGRAMLAERDLHRDGSYVRTRMFWSWFLDRFQASAESREEARANLDALATEASARADVESEANVHRLEWLMAFANGDFARSHAIAEKAIETERRLGRWSRLARSYSDRAVASLYGDDAERCARDTAEAIGRTSAIGFRAERERVELCAAVAPYVFGVVVRDAARVEALMKSDAYPGGPHRSLAHACLAIDAAERSDWSSWCAHAEATEGTMSLGWPPNLVGRFLGPAFALRSSDPAAPRVRECAREVLERIALSVLDPSNRLAAVVTELRAAACVR